MNKQPGKTNILFLFWGRRGGGARYSYEISKELLNRRDVNLSISVSNQCDIIEKFKSLECPGLYVDTYSSVPGFINKWIFQRNAYRRKLIEFLKQHQIDVLIMGMDFFWGSVIYDAADQLEVKTIYVVHEPQPHPKEPFFMGVVKKKTLKTLITGADHLVALIPHVKEYLLNRYKMDESKVSVIPHGVFSYYEANEYKKLPENGLITILYFGAITYYKGLDILLKAYKILENKYESIRLEVWGYGSLTEYEDLIAELNRVNIENRWIDEKEIPALFANSHICVLPYRDVSQSGIVGAAARAALPIVACPLDGLKEQIEGREILFSEDFTPQSLAISIERLIKDPKLYSQVSENLLELSKKLNWSSIASEFNEIAQQLKNNRSVSEDSVESP